MICPPFFCRSRLLYYSLEVAKLKREAGTAASVPAAEASGGGAEAGLSPAWDTPEARELRAKIRTLEREARKKEAVLKVGRKALSGRRGGEREARKREVVLLLGRNGGGIFIRGGGGVGGTKETGGVAGG